MDLITVGQQLQAAVLRAYQQMEHEGKDQCRVSYLADRAAFQVQTKSVAEGTVIGYADSGNDRLLHSGEITRYLAVMEDYPVCIQHRQAEVMKTSNGIIWQQSFQTVGCMKKF